MWTSRSEPLPNARGQRFEIHVESKPATFAQIMEGMRRDESFRSVLTATLAGVPYTAFRWETPSVTAATQDRPFEFVVLDSPGLARRPEPEAFAEHFEGRKEDVISFPNLGGDAVMVVPRPLAEPDAYGHLAAFLRKAPDVQRHALWREVGVAMAKRIDARPVWLSTAGGGVSWLHVRLDDRPKYYGYEAYRKVVC